MPKWCGAQRSFTSTSPGSKPLTGQGSNHRAAAQLGCRFLPAWPPLGDILFTEINVVSVSVFHWNALRSDPCTPTRFHVCRTPALQDFAGVFMGVFLQSQPIRECLILWWCDALKETAFRSDMHHVVFINAQRLIGEFVIIGMVRDYALY